MPRGKAVAGGVSLNVNMLVEHRLLHNPHDDLNKCTSSISDEYFENIIRINKIITAVFIIRLIDSHNSFSKHCYIIISLFEH